VPADAASGKFHEFIPIMGLFATATPIFFEIMEDWSPLVISASAFPILILKIILSTTLIDASKLALFGQEFLLTLRPFGFLFLFLLFL
jgi:hypothetical protein